MDFEKNSGVYDRLLKARRLHARIRVTANATAASKTHTPDLPDLIKIKTEGKDDVTGSDAAASTDMSTKTDSSGTFGVCMLATGLGTIERVIAVTVQPIDGGTCTSLLVNTGTTAYGLTAAGNIAINGDSSRDFSSASLDVILTVDYLRRAN